MRSQSSQPGLTASLYSFARYRRSSQAGFVCGASRSTHGPQAPWHPGMAHRLKLPRGLLRALEGAPGESVLDCTFGMGHDTLILLNAGLNVLAVDRCAALLFSLDGLTRYAPGHRRQLTISGRTTVNCSRRYRGIPSTTFTWTQCFLGDTTAVVSPGPSCGP